MVDQNPDLDLSPLDQIRRTEAEVTRKIAAARKAAEQILEETRRQVATLKQEALETGTREGRANYNALISKAEEESRALVAEAQYQAKMLRRRGQGRMPKAVSDAVNFVINLAEDVEET